MAISCPQLPLDDLTDEELYELVAALMIREEEKREEKLGRLVEQATLIEGKKGRGKTLSAVALSWWIRELFNRPVITVGSKMGLKPDSYGPHLVMNELDFRNELEKISVAAAEEENADKVAQAFEKYGISLLYSTLILDEAYKLLDVRRSSDKLVQLFGYFVAQSRHYHVTIILLCPNREMIDKRVRQQLDWQGRVYHNKYTNKARLRLISGIETLTIEVDGKKDPGSGKSFYDMYDSWAMLGFRGASLNVKV